MPTSRIALALALSLALTTASTSQAQLVAFPGAEGAAKFVSGGRGGDVYKVTNLNDSGVGSLRYGIQNAPSPGRTIVFDVAGTINLTSSLDFDGKSNITIAGQTAPAGGITLANHRLRINSADNVIVQFLRVRPGDTYGSQDPDAVWVQTSTNVMLDHITASWGVDETISTTHNSNFVTVQWSTMSQGLYDGGHSEGSGHSYGSLINGGAYTYHHNLYAHNKSRHPRAQSSGNYLILDFVNNVIFNPQDRFGYNDSDDPYDVNLVGNYGLKGPRSKSNDYLFDSKDADSHYYVEGNYTDITVDGVVNGSEVDEDAVFRPGGAYTLFPSRLGASLLPAVNTDSADDAYIQVLSRAGAVNYRDTVDRQLIRSVLNQFDLSIGTQAEMGGWPSLPTGPAPADSNNDGVPDTWAAENYGNTSTPLHTTYAPSGYTYLEEYLHSLTPNAYAPTQTVEHVVRTSFGRGADAQLNENGGLSSGNGTGPSLDAQWSGTAGATNQMLVLRFDLSELELGSVTNARLELTTDANTVGTHQFKVYGLEHDATGFDWHEGTVAFDTMTGVTFDGNSGTLGIDPSYSASDPFDLPDLLRLGEFSLGSTSAGQTISFENPNLEVFLNLAAYFEGEPSEGLVTLLLEQVNDTGSSPASFYSKEGSSVLAPQLVLEASVVPIDNADFDGDGDVDGQDFLIWQRGAGHAGSQASGDSNGDGNVDASDLAIWRMQYGTAPGTTSSAAVPEPSILAGFCCILLLAINRRRAAR